MDDKLREKVKLKLQEERLSQLEDKELKEQVKQRLHEERSNELLTRELPELTSESVDPEIVWSKGFKRVSVGTLSQYFRELSVLLQAGFPLLRALRVIGHGRSHRLMSATLTHVAIQVENGIALWRAMEQHPRIFPPIVISTIRAGESSGTLEEALEHLADSLEYEADVRSKVRSAFDYPIFFGVLTLAILLFLFLVVLPRFQEVYAQLDHGGAVQSPYFQALLLIQTMLPWLIGIGGCAGVAIVYAFKSRRFMLLEKIKLRIPLFGRLLLFSDLTRFSKTLSVQARNSVPILESLRLCRLVLDNRELKDVVEQMETHVEQGGSLSGILHQHPLIPRAMVDLVEVGEESGSLSTTMDYLSKMLQNKLENMISRLTALLQPFLLLVMGSVVIVVFVAMLTPYFEVLDRLQNAGLGPRTQISSSSKSTQKSTPKVAQSKGKKSFPKVRTLKKHRSRTAPPQRVPIKHKASTPVQTPTSQKARL